MVYFDVTKNLEGDDYDRNRRLEAEVKKAVEENEKEALMVLGDMNAHMELLEENRKDDANGKMIMEWISELGLVLMNADEKCRGKYTWSRGDQRSAIDMVLMNGKLYELCSEMVIDEEKEELNISDHCLVTTELRLREKGGVKFGKEKKKITYYKRDRETLEKVRDEVKKVWREGMGGAEMWEKLVETHERIAKREFEVRVGKKRGKKIVEAEWVTREIREEVKKRRRYNRMKKNTRGRERERWEGL